jgi:hypothetical protein
MTSSSSLVGLADSVPAWTELSGYVIRTSSCFLPSTNQAIHVKHVLQTLAWPITYIAGLTPVDTPSNAHALTLTLTCCRDQAGEDV